METTDTVFFFNNFHKCQYFLSMYEVNEGNKVVVPNEQSYLNFLKKIIPDNEIIVIPKIRVFKPLTPRNMFETIVLTLFCRLYCAKHLKDAKNAVFFSDMTVLEQWVLTKYLAKRNVNITHYNCYGDFSVEPVATNQFSLFWQLKYKLLKFISGVNFSFARAALQNFEMPKLIHNYHVVPSSGTDLKPWPEIKRKFNFTIDLGTAAHNSLLIIDGPVQSFEIKERETVDKLVSFFEKKLEAGKKIFLKPHYGAGFTSFDNNEGFLNSITILEKSFPVELIMDFFPENYFFTSCSALNKNCETEKYCLQNLIEFKDSNAEKSFQEILKQSVEDEYKNIRFVQLDKGL